MDQLPFPRLRICPLIILPPFFFRLFDSLACLLIDDLEGIEGKHGEEFAYHHSMTRQMQADDKATDLEAWLDHSVWELGYPKRLVDIVRKRLYGIPLNHNDQMYLNRFRQKEQKPMS